MVDEDGGRMSIQIHFSLRYKMSEKKGIGQIKIHAKFVTRIKKWRLFASDRKIRLGRKRTKLFFHRCILQNILLFSVAPSKSWAKSTISDDALDFLHFPTSVR